MLKTWDDSCSMHYTSPGDIREVVAQETFRFGQGGLLTN
jgi:hypothetical protein